MAKRRIILAFVWGMTLPSAAQNFLHRLDSMLSENYGKVKYDTAYIKRPEAKWAVLARINMSGAFIEAEGFDDGQRHKAQMEANQKATLSLGVSYLGLTLSASLNPAKLMGKYKDYELNFKCYRRNFGFDISYQDARDFTGWYEEDGIGRIDLPDDVLRVRTLNLNTYYAFNNRRFSYPAAFSQSYIQHRSAGSFLLAASGMWQLADDNWEEPLKLRMTNIGIGAGYGYNFVPGQGWLLHISALPTFIVYSNTLMTYDDDRMSLHYRFPEVIITARGAAVRQWSNKFLGLSMVYNYSNIGNKDYLTVNNAKWLVQAFFGVRI